jgi:hypothetical protein
MICEEGIQMIVGARICTQDMNAGTVFGVRASLRAS